MIATYARAAFAAGYAEVEEAFPVPPEVALAMRAAVETAETWSEQPAVLYAAREAGRREALNVVVKRRRDQLETRWASQLRPLAARVGKMIAPQVAQYFRPKEAVQPEEDPMEVIQQAMDALIQSGDWEAWKELLSEAHKEALAEGQAGAAVWLADAKAQLVPSFDITFQTTLDALSNLPAMWNDAETWLGKVTHGLAYDVGRQVSDQIASGASYDQLLSTVTNGFGATDTDGNVMLGHMIAQGCNQGSLDLYTSEGLEQVDILTSPGAEEICTGLEDQNPWDITDAENQIPAHIGCRCAWTPVVA